MDARTRELLDGMETKEAEAIEYLKNNASRLGERILFYSIFIHPRWRNFYLNKDGTIDEESKRLIDDEYKITCEGQPLNNNFVKEYGHKALVLAVETLGKELDKQQPLLPFPD